MPMILLTIARYLGFAGCVAVGMFVFYEGLPLGPLRYIPYVGPQLEQLVDGRVDREYRRGAAAERIVWEDRLRVAERERDAEVAAKQSELDQLALDYYNLRAENRLNIVQLDEAIAAAEKEEANAPEDVGPVCRRFIPRSVSNQLNAIGRKPASP